MEQLIREKWVCEGAVASLPRGRHPTLLELNEDLVVIAVDIHPKEAIVATVDLKGRLLSRSMVPLTSDPAASTRLLTDCMLRMRQALPRKSIEGIGISLPGRVDPETQRLIFAPNLHWPDFDLKKVIEKSHGPAGKDGKRRPPLACWPSSLSGAWTGFAISCLSPYRKAWEPAYSPTGN